MGTLHYCLPKIPDTSSIVLELLFSKHDIPFAEILDERAEKDFLKAERQGSPASTSGKDVDWRISR